MSNGELAVRFASVDVQTCMGGRLEVRVPEKNGGTYSIVRKSYDTI